MKKNFKSLGLSFVMLSALNVLSVAWSQDFYRNDELTPDDRKGSQKFQVTLPLPDTLEKLKIGSLCANVSIVINPNHTSTSQSFMQYTGPESFYNKVNIDNNIDFLSVMGHDQPQNNTIHIGRIVISGYQYESITTSGFTHEELPQFSFSIPEWCALDLEAYGGNWNITGTTKMPAEIILQGSSNVKVGTLENGGSVIVRGSGQFEAHTISGEQFVGRIQGSGDIKINNLKAKGTSLNVQGSGDVNIKTIETDLADVNVQGSGDVSINGGTIQNLTSNLRGSGDISISAPATNANLSLQGSGDMKISKVINKPVQNLNGSGKIKVGNWPSPKRSDNSSGVTVRVGPNGAVVSSGGNITITNTHGRTTMNVNGQRIVTENNGPLIDVNAILRNAFGGNMGF